MPSYLPIALVGAVFAGLAVWRIADARRARRVTGEALGRLGFAPCPDRKAWLEETLARIENNRGFRIEVRDAKRLPGTDVYHCIKIRLHPGREHSVTEEEVLFPLERPSPAGLVLAVKPSSLAPGPATRLIGAVATGPWDAQPDDLQRIELPPELKDTNLLGALGPPGARLYDLIDSGALAVVQGLGDAGALVVRCRDGWCAVAGSAQIPLRADQIVARIRSLL